APTSTDVGRQGPGGSDVVLDKVLVGHPEPEFGLDEKKDLQQRHRVEAGELEIVVRLKRMAAGHDPGVDERGQDGSDLFGLDSADARGGHRHARWRFLRTDMSSSTLQSPPHQVNTVVAGHGFAGSKSCRISARSCRRRSLTCATRANCSGVKSARTSSMTFALS